MPATRSNQTVRKPGDCKTRTPRSADVKLPVVAVDPQTGMKHSRAGKWRAYVLAGVHLVMIAHFIHWRVAGRTLTPIEPSESMETIRLGEINMGFLFFAAAMLATLVFGRWVCGWGCHLVAYQDLTLWVFKKLKMRPKAFRTRFLLIAFPFIAAFWMFLWPLVFRIWQAIQGIPGPRMTWHLTRTGFWETFPGPLFGVLTILACGVAVVYFLGPKGFCTFACPYGAFFGFLDKFSPSRIRVNDDCKQCGHCTAACTSNVDVAREVNLYKMVVDPGCMKCLDCVEVCPNDALRVGMGLPAILAKADGPPKPKRYDLTLGEEILALFVFLLALVTINGLYGQFPFLMSLGMAGIFMFMFMKWLRLFHARDVMFQKLRLKAADAIRPVGYAYMVAMFGLTALLGHSAIWRYHDLRAAMAFRNGPNDSLDWQYDPTFNTHATPEQMENARTALHHLEACESWGLFGEANNHLQHAWLCLFTDKPERAVNQIEKAIAIYPNKAHIWLKLAAVETWLNHPDAAREAYERAIELEKPERESLTAKAGPVPHPLSARIWSAWGWFQVRNGDPKGGAESLNAAAGFDPNAIQAHLYLGQSEAMRGDSRAARKAFLEALRRSPGHPELNARLNALRLTTSDQDEAARDYRQALRDIGDHVVLLHNLGHAMTAQAMVEPDVKKQTQAYQEAVGLYRRALRIAPRQSPVRADLGAVLLVLQDMPGAIKEYEVIIRQEPENIEALNRLGQLYQMAGRRGDLVNVLKLMIEHGDEATRDGAKKALDHIENTP